MNKNILHLKDMERKSKACGPWICNNCIAKIQSEQSSVEGPGRSSDTESASESEPVQDIDMGKNTSIHSSDTDTCTEGETDPNTTEAASFSAEALHKTNVKTTNLDPSQIEMCSDEDTVEPNTSGGDTNVASGSSKTDRININDLTAVELSQLAFRLGREIGSSIKEDAQLVSMDNSLEDFLELNPLEYIKGRNSCLIQLLIGIANENMCSLEIHPNSAYRLAKAAESVMGLAAKNFFTSYPYTWKHTAV